MTMDMNKDKETLLNEYSDEIARIIVKMYEGVHQKQEDSYYENLEDIENGVVDALNAWEKTCQTTRAQLDILMELMIKLEDTFPQYMAPSCIMTKEGVVEY